MLTRDQKIQGGMWGLLVGDALGVPYEFHGPQQIPPFDEIEFEPPSNFARAHRGVPPGSWSDDGAHALCLAASLLYRDQLDPEDLMRRLTNWNEFGYLAADGRVFDIGIQTSNALTTFREGGTAAIDCGPRGIYDNGNGSLMRVLPLALWHRGTDEELVRDARTQSLITHGHLRSQLCCALYCLWARRILEGSTSPWLDALTTLRSMLAPRSEDAIELEEQVRPESDEPGRGTGYVVDSLRSSRQLIERCSSYEQVVKGAVQLGNDTDTTAAIAGGIAGLMYGVEGIPARWRESMRDQGTFMPFVEQLAGR
jgi:ADP-ribosyl-[dinitrogen reductase] hydrolase